MNVLDAKIIPNADEISEGFAGYSPASLIDRFSGYNQSGLHLQSQDLTAIQTLLGRHG